MIGLLLFHHRHKQQACEQVGIDFELITLRSGGFWPTAPTEAVGRGADMLGVSHGFDMYPATASSVARESRRVPLAFWAQT